MPTYRVPAAITWPGPGGPGVNVWHFNVSGVVQDEEQNLAEALDALEAFYTSIRTLYYGASTITIGEGMIRDPLGSPTYATDDSRVIIGQGAQAGPTILQIVAGWRTASATRSGRGRTFLGPLIGGANDVATGIPTAAVTAQIAAAANTLVADSTSANGWALAVLSQEQNVSRDVVGVSVRQRFAFLSSRRD